MKEKSRKWIDEANLEEDSYRHKSINDAESSNVLPVKFVIENFSNERRSLIDLQKTFEKEEFDIEIDKDKTLNDSDKFRTQNLKNNLTNSTDQTIVNRPISQAVRNTPFHSTPIEVKELKSSDFFQFSKNKGTQQCLKHQCQNYIKCVDDSWDGYECICKPGWMGKNCDRPCKDIYGTCSYWMRHGQCETQRDSTDFFDLNCAQSCGKCIFDNTTIGSWIPLPSVLLPLGRLLGVWETSVNGNKNLTLDYPISFADSGYTEKLTITVGIPLIFGTPVINFTSEATGKSDVKNQHIVHGFMTIRDYSTNIQHASLITTSNFGLIMIEDGALQSSTIRLTPRYRYPHPSVAEKMPIEMDRWFTNVGDHLIQVISVTNKQGRKQRLTKTYRKTKTVDYL